MSSAGARLISGNRLTQFRDYLGRLVCGERRLCQVPRPGASARGELQPGDVFRAFHDVETVRCLTEGPDDLLVVGMADQDEL